MILVALAAVLAIPFDAATRASLPPAGAVFKVHGAVQPCTGVWLRDLVGRANAPQGEAVRGSALAMMVTATAADGYRVVLSLGELDASLGKATILVADRCDGKLLAAGDGPVRLVAAGEARGARSVKHLVRLTLE